MAEDLRVVHLAAYGGPYPGSFIPMIEAARTATEARGWSFEAVFSDGVQRRPWHTELLGKGVRTHVAPRLDLRQRTGWVRGLLARRPAPTILHTHFSAWDLPAAFAAADRRDAGVVWHLHTRLQDEPVARLRNLVRFGGVGRLVDRMLCVGPEVRDKAIARLAPPARTQLFPNGIDVDRFRPLAAGERDAIRARLGVNAGAEVVMLFGWDWETKGGPLLLAALSELRARRRPIHALIVGGEQRAGAEALLAGLTDAVRPLAPVDDPRELYGAVDVFIAASVAEGFSFALLEALACGTPVVASDIPGHRYSGGSLPGCRFAPRRASAFADAIEAELASDPANRAARLAVSREQIERDLSLTHWSQRLADLYAKIATSRR